MGINNARDGLDKSLETGSNGTETRGNVLGGGASGADDDIGKHSEYHSLVLVWLHPPQDGGKLIQVPGRNGISKLAIKSASMQDVAFHVGISDEEHFFCL